MRRDAASGREGPSKSAPRWAQRLKTEVEQLERQVTLLKASRWVQARAAGSGWARICRIS